jgi:hypothetical protein
MDLSELLSWSHEDFKNKLGLFLGNTLIVVDTYKSFAKHHRCSDLKRVSRNAELEVEFVNHTPSKYRCSRCGDEIDVKLLTKN